jgi:hypothetical protein
MYVNMYVCTYVCPRRENRLRAFDTTVMERIFGPAEGELKR